MDESYKFLSKKPLKSVPIVENHERVLGCM